MRTKEMIVFCKDNFWKIACPDECSFYNACRELDHKDERTQNGIHFALDYNPDNPDETLEEQRIREDLPL